MNSYFIDNKYNQLLRVVQFYERQIDVLDSMLYDVAGKYLRSTSEADRIHFRRAFHEKQIEIEHLKRNLTINKKMLNEDLEINHGQNADELIRENLKIEEDVNQLEKEINRLNNDFKYFVTHNI
jgi:hypothetical protein